MAGAPIQEVYRGVNTSRPYTHMYYGPSSNFAFLQHVHHTFADHSREPSSITGNFPSILDQFKQREIFFDLPDDSAAATESSRGSCLFLPQPLARQFFDNFCASIYHLTYLEEQKELDQFFAHLFEDGIIPRSSSLDYAILLCSLAIGASVTNHDKWATSLYETARDEAAKIGDAVNLKSIQVSLLMAHYQLIYGRPNSAYLELGAACRRAFAAGLHSDICHNKTTTHTSSPEQQRATIWALIFFERWVAFWLGRPSSTGSMALSVPMPQRAPVVKCLGELSSIVEQTAHDIYGDQRLSPSKLWESAQSIRFRLEEFRRRTEISLGVPLDGSLGGPRVNLAQVFIMNCKPHCHFAVVIILICPVFCHVWMITFRPFLIIYYSWRKHIASSVSVQRLPREGDLPIDLCWLPEACQVAVDYAHKLIDVFGTAVTRSDLVKVSASKLDVPIVEDRMLSERYPTDLFQGLVFSASFLESACCLLFYDAMRAQDSVDTHIESLRKATDCFAAMIGKGPLPSITHTAQRLLRELRRLHQDGRDTAPRSKAMEAAGNETNDSRVEIQPVPGLDLGGQGETLGGEMWPPGYDPSLIQSDTILDDFIFAPGLDEYFTFPS